MTRSADLTSEGCFVNELIMPVKCQKSVLHIVSAQWKWSMLVLLLMPSMCQQSQVGTLKGDFRKLPLVLQSASRKGRTPSLPHYPPQWKEGPRELITSRIRIIRPLARPISR